MISATMRASLPLPTASNADRNGVRTGASGSSRRGGGGVLSRRGGCCCVGRGRGSEDVGAPYALDVAIVVRELASSCASASTVAWIFVDSFAFVVLPTPGVDEDSLVGIVSTYCETAETGGDPAANTAPGRSRAASAESRTRDARATGELTGALSRRLA
jgi:hypothetical protein